MSFGWCEHRLTASREFSYAWQPTGSQRQSGERISPPMDPWKIPPPPSCPPPHLACQSTRHRPSQETGDAASQFPLPSPPLSKVSWFQSWSQLPDKGWVGLGEEAQGVPACWPVTQSLPDHSLSKTASAETFIPWLPLESRSCHPHQGNGKRRGRESGTWLGEAILGWST